MLRYLPGAILAGRISYETANSSAFSAKLWPARTVRTFASTSSGVFLKRSLIHASAGSLGRGERHQFIPLPVKSRPRKIGRAERTRALSAEEAILAAMTWKSGGR